MPILTAYENVEAPMVLASKLRRRDRKRRTAMLLEQVGLADRMDHYPSELSGGQQQRVAVARAIVSQPSIVLADEPTANLDSKTGQGLLEMMRAMNLSHGVTFIFSTHDARVVKKARRVITLEDGKVLTDERKN